MPATILEGHALADQLLAETRAKADAITARLGRRPRLAILLMGDNPGALAYASRQAQFAERAGVSFDLRRLSAEASQQDVLNLVTALNADPCIDAILPMFPLAPQIDVAMLTQTIDPAKDVDGLSPANAGRLAIGLEALAPCTPQGAVALAESVVGDLKGQVVTIVGASISVGRPLAQMVLKREATITIAHVATRDLSAACRSADLLFVAVGKAGLIKGEHVKPGAVVVDIGINLIEEAGAKRIVGDVDIASVQDVARIITAAPDGVGPLTTAFLMANTVRAAQSLAGMR